MTVELFVIVWTLVVVASISTGTRLLYLNPQSRWGFVAMTAGVFSFIVWLAFVARLLIAYASMAGAPTWT